MGNVATPEFLIARWNELCRLQIALGAELMRQLPDGVAASAAERAGSSYPVTIALPPPIPKP